MSTNMSHAGRPGVGAGTAQLGSAVRKSGKEKGRERRPPGLLTPRTGWCGVPDVRSRAVGLSCCHLAPLLGAGLALRLAPWAGQGDGQRVYGEGVSEPGVMGQSSPPWPCSPRFGAGGGDAAVEAEAVLSWARCLPSLQGIAPRPVPLCAGLAKAQKKKGEICGVGAVLDLQGPPGCPMQPWALDPAWC